MILLLASTIFVGCVAESAWQRLSASEFKEAIDNEEGHFLLDVRTLPEWEQEGYIEGATLIPSSEIESRADELPADKNTTILLYCKGGNRSSDVSIILKDMGYTDIRDLKTGIKGWKDAGYDVQY